MKQYLTALMMLMIAQNAAAVKLEQSDFEGRGMMIVDQENGELSSVLVVNKNFKAILQGQTSSMTLDCSGTAAVDEAAQTIEALMKCTDGEMVRMKLALPKDDQNVAYVLQGSFASTTLELKSTVSGTPDFSKTVYSGQVEIKRLGKK